MSPGTGVDALDPELAEVPLAGAAVPEGVLHRVHELLVGRTVCTALVSVVPLRLFQNGAVVLATMYGSLDSGHRGSSSLLVVLVGAQQIADRRSLVCNQMPSILRTAFSSDLETSASRPSRRVRTL